VEFSSVFDAVRCAAALQRAMIDREAASRDDRKKISLYHQSSSLAVGSRHSYRDFAVVPVRISALRLSAVIRPSMPSFLKMVANSERRVATSLIAPSR